MKFRIWTILWIFALFASAMATFGGAGIVAACVIVGLWALILNHSEIALVHVLLIVAVVVMLVVLLLPAVASVRGASRRLWCMNNMKQVALSLHNYHDANGYFPLASATGSDGKPWHSWRLMIIPFVESNSWYGSYDQKESWDGPNNSKIVTGTPCYIYECPTHSDDRPFANYFAVVGPRAAWQEGRRRNLSEFKDGTARTILLLEAPRKVVPWAKPGDLSFEEAAELLSNPPNDVAFGHRIDKGFFWQPAKAVCAAFADGRIELLELPISRHHAEALLTVDGGEDVDPQDVAPTKSPELRYARMYALSVFVLLSVTPTLKLLGRRKATAASLRLAGDA